MCRKKNRIDESVDAVCFFGICRRVIELMRFKTLEFEANSRPDATTKPRSALGQDDRVDHVDDSVGRI